MKKRFNKMAFSQQIRAFYVAVFLVIFILCGFLYMVTSFEYVSDSEDNTLEYGLQIVNSNMESLFENINDYSKVIAFNHTVQDVLQRNVDTAVSYDDTIQLQEAVIQIVACCDGISSVYLFDNSGEAYMAGDAYETESIQAYLRDTKLQERSGGEQENQVGSVMFSYKNESNEMKQVLSYVRPIRDLDTLEALGTLAMNISMLRIEETYASVSDQIGMNVAILDSEGNVIVTSENGSWLSELISEGTLMKGQTSYQIVNHNEKKYKAGFMDAEDGSWTIVGAISRSATAKDLQQIMIYTVAVMIVGMGLCVFGASFITQRINQPLQNMLSSMEKVKKGQLEHVPVIETNQEMNALQVHYNQMLAETEHLMAQRIEEQRLRRKYELSLLQAQIKPHFLYNTFDSVCALAMMGRTQDVYTMMQALGQYYRNSLNKGREVITIKEELVIVENYLIIQSFRYDDVFDVVYDVDESVKPYMMIKLILQPLVENAIYHGLREHQLTGTITIRAKDFGDYVMLQVQDDGSGMPKEKLDEVLQRNENNQGKRFGLYGTIQRINLFYQSEKKNLVDIESEIGEGTVITVWIPKEKGEQDAECFSD